MNNENAFGKEQNGDNNEEILQPYTQNVADSSAVDGTDTKPEDIVEGLVIDVDNKRDGEYTQTTTSQLNEKAEEDTEAHEQIPKNSDEEAIRLEETQHNEMPKKSTYAFHWNFLQETKKNDIKAKKRNRKDLIIYSIVVTTAFALCLAVLVIVLSSNKISKAGQNDMASDAAEVSSMQSACSENGSNIVSANEELTMFICINK